MSSGAEHYAAAEAQLALAESTNSAMALRCAGTHAQLALAASNIAVAMQNKPATNTVTTDMTAWTAATKSTGVIAAIKVNDDGQIIPPTTSTPATVTAGTAVGVATAIKNT